MREGSLDAPIRHALDWTNPDFYNEEKLDEELRRVFDICHGCRRCFNLCDSFPRLFDLIDESESGELDTVDSQDFKPVVDACTLCDMCFMVKCPYVPPHEFDLDFPHLMLRYRAVEFKKGMHGGLPAQLTETDRNGKISTVFSGIANWASKTDNELTRGVLEKCCSVDKRAELPEFAAQEFVKKAKDYTPKINKDAPGFGRKAVLYATCFANYNDTIIAEAAREVLHYNGVETEVVYPECCGMPQLEQGDIARVAGKAENVASILGPYIDQGYDVIALVPSCALMLKFEWPLMVPGSDAVKKLSQASFDISEYVMDLAKKEGLANGLKPLDGPVSLHIACHARSQNMGQKATELMKLIPDVGLKVVERCSGHGGSWGIKKENFDTAIKVGRPVYRQMANNGASKYVVSECPLAGLHIAQGMEMSRKDGDDSPKPETVPHPIVLLAHAFGLMDHS